MQRTRVADGLTVLMLSGLLAACGGGSGAVSVPAQGGGGSGVVSVPVQDYQITGSITGLNAGTSVSLLDNGNDTLAVFANGNFTFPTQLPSGATYNVTITAQPAGQFCSVSGGSGTVASGNVTGVQINCIPAQVSFTSPGKSTWTVPAGVTSIAIEAVGAGGGCSNGIGAAGADVKATLAVTPGQTLSLNVGAGGVSGLNPGSGLPGEGGAGGSGSGAGGVGIGGTGDGGGAATTVAVGGVTVLVAGGGGGAGGGGSVAGTVLGGGGGGGGGGGYPAGQGGIGGPGGSGGGTGAAGSNGIVAPAAPSGSVVTGGANGLAGNGRFGGEGGAGGVGGTELGGSPGASAATYGGGGGGGGAGGSYGSAISTTISQSTNTCSISLTDPSGTGINGSVSVTLQ